MEDGFKVLSIVATLIGLYLFVWLPIRLLLAIIHRLEKKD